MLKATKLEELEAANRIAIMPVVIRFLEVGEHVFEGVGSQYDPSNRDTISRRDFKEIRV
jgi:hypothetical protein